MTGSSLPAPARGVASFQTRRSNGTGSFSTMIKQRLRCVSLPCDAIVTPVEFLSIGDANEINYELIGPQRRCDSVEFRIVISNNDSLAMGKRVIEGINE